MSKLKTKEIDEWFFGFIKELVMSVRHNRRFFTKNGDIDRLKQIYQIIQKYFKYTEEVEKSVTALKEMRKRIQNQPEPGGLKPGEYMHEWLEEDAVRFDLPDEEIIGALARDNKLLKDKLDSQPEITIKEIQGWAEEARIRVMAHGDWRYVEDVMKEMAEEWRIKVIK